MDRLIRMFLLAGLVTGCTGKEEEPTQADSDSGVPDEPDGTDDTPDDDSGRPPHDTGDPSTPGFEWTTGPALPDCSPQEGTSGNIALSGVVLGPDGPIGGHLVYSPIDGRILCADEDCDVRLDTVVCTEGVISPGLIDVHNHMQYNILPPWQHDSLFDSRYDWQGASSYRDYRTAYDEVSNSESCDIMKWAELRSLVGGATSVVGSSGGSCIDVLIRNLDEDEAEHGISDYDLYYSSSNVLNAFDAGDAVTPGSRYDAVACHVAEGVQGSVRSEINHMIDIGMTGEGQIFVHATDATTEQLAQLADLNTTIAWSPRSNLDLYAATTAADVAHRLGMNVVLGPDWTWSGSLNPTREMACANTYLRSRNSTISDKTLWEWTTSSAARALGLDGRLGSLEPGLLADISVYAWSDEPYRAIIESEATDVRLVLIAGVALYGAPDLMSGLVDQPEWCESVSACGTERTLCVKTADSGEDSRTAAQIEDNLTAALAAESMPAGLEYAGELFGLWMCEESRSSCDISDASSDDADGDGIEDGVDVCVGAFDPLQRDHDADGTGDACDPCPLDPASDTCTHTPGDIDGDGTITADDVCPYLADPDQADRDSDGKGDVCDLCPDEANPGDAGCTFSVQSLRDPDAEDHPPQGSDVTVHSLVVTAIQADSGFYAQDPSTERLGGLFVYDGGTHSSETSASPVTIGDTVTVIGVYEEYYGLTEIKSSTVTITGTGDPITPASVSNPCDVATGGTEAEDLESMLITVSDVTVTDANPDAPDDYAEFEVDGCLRVDDLLSEALVPQPDVGTHYTSLSGVLNFSYGHHKLIHRGAEDVEE